MQYLAEKLRHYKGLLIGVDTLRGKSVLMQVQCVIIGSTDLPFNVSTPFNTYQQAFIARMP